MSLVYRLPGIIAIGSYAAATVYLVNADWRSGLYWLLAGTIAVVVTVLALSWYDRRGR